MMTREEAIEILKALPYDLREENGIQIPYDLTNKPYELVNGYKYFPDGNCMLFGSRIVVWLTEPHTSYKVDPYNPEHFAELKRRGMRFQNNDTIGVIIPGKEDHIVCRLYGRKYWPDKYLADGEKYKSFSFDGTEIYYNASIFDIEKDKQIKQLMECLFVADRYNWECICPYGDDPKEEWEAVD